MVFHPRQHWPGRRARMDELWGRALRRRDFLRLTGGSALAAVLAACGGNGGGPSGNGGIETTEVQVGTPDNPITHPITDDNPPIESGLEPEDGPLRIYNWADYIWPRVLNDFADEYGVEFELTTFYNLEEAIRKLRTDDVSFDIFFPTAENIPKVVAGGILQPLNHDYLPNLQANIWPRLTDPFYDSGSGYTVPYAVYQTGIGWRTDMIDTDIESMDNPWQAFQDPAHRDITGLYDDYRETMGVGVYMAGSTDINTDDPSLIEESKQELLRSVRDVNVAFTIDGAYIKLPEASLGLHHAWSGDLAAAPYYAPRGVDPTALRYLWPPNAPNANTGGYVSNDAIGIPSNAEHPVLAHHFLNYMLDRDVALKNFSWVLYQPPLVDLDPEQLVTDEYIPDYLTSTLVFEEDFGVGQLPLQLPPSVDANWIRAWAEVQSG